MVRLKSDDDILDSDHVVRYCSPQHVHNGKIAESAFALRNNDNYLSVNWLEYFNQPTVTQCLEYIKNSLGIKVKGNGRFARIHVGTAKQKINDIQIKYEPMNQNPSHAGIYPPAEKNRESTLQLASLVSNNDIFLVPSK